MDSDSIMQCQNINSTGKNEKFFDLHDTFMGKTICNKNIILPSDGSVK